MTLRRVSSHFFLFFLFLFQYGLYQAFALDPSKEIAQYSRRVWLKKEGLPQNSVLAMAQTPNGYLWLGTMEGLARFDGHKFVVYNYRNTPQLSAPIISALRISRDSTLWIGTTGNGLVRYREGRFSHVKGPPQTISSTVRTIYEASNGVLWVSTSDGLACVKGDSVVRLFTSSDGLPYGLAYSIAEDEEGHLLVAGREGIEELNEDCFKPYTRAKGVSSVPLVLYKDHNGRLWVGTFNKGVFCLSGDSLKQYSSTDGLSSDYVSCLTEDVNGGIWVGTVSGGVNRIYGKRISVFGSREGLSMDEVHSVFEDREGNMWVGLSGGGLTRFVDPKFVTLPLGSTASQNMAWSIFEDHRGTIFAGNSAGNIFELKSGTFIPSVRVKKPLNGIPFTFCEDHHGFLWIGTSKGAYREKNGRVEHFPFGFVSAILEDSFGRVWIGAGNMLLVFDKGKFIQCKTNSGEWLPNVRLLYEDSRKTLWIGLREKGVYALDLREVSPAGDLPPLQKFTQKNGFLSSSVMSVSEDGTGSIWVTTFGGGLSQIDSGRVRTFTSSSGLPSDVLYNALDDRAGNLWISTNNGVFRVSLRSLREYARGERTSVEATTFGTEDGMVSDECNGGNNCSGFRTRTGKLLFPTTWGVVMVDPSSLPTNTVPPTVVIEKIIVDRAEFPSRGDFSSPPGDGEIEFQYDGVSFSAAERVRFKTKLEGFDHDWIDSEDRTSAHYTNIPPGDYTFRVRACNGDGVWNEAGASASFILRPHFYQTIWFYTLCGLVVMMVGAGVHSLYRRDRDRQLVASQLESKLAQAQLKVLEMQLQPHFLFNTLNGIMVLIHGDPDKASRMLARLSEFLRSTLERTGDQEVPLQKELDLVHRYLDIEQIRFGDRLTVSNNVCNQLRDALVPTMILQPLVENAIRHGVSKRRGPAWIQINADQTDGMLVLTVRDNGAGVDGQNPAELHEGVGLGNTRARLKQLYGNAYQFSLMTPETGGFEVSLAIPLHKREATV